MKKFLLILLTFALIIGFSGCSYKDSVIDSLPDYKNKQYYSMGLFHDFTDYAKYTYNSVTSHDLDASEYFSITTAEDIPEILLHIENFEDWVEKEGGKLKENYDFDKSVISEGDFFYIKTKYGQQIGQQGTYGKFDSYSVYYFDLDTQVLYYFHSNI